MIDPNIAASTILFILFCAIPAAISYGKGEGFWSMFFLSAFITPIIGLIVALCIRVEPRVIIVERRDPR
jgi:hypothetical protein